MVGRQNMKRTIVTRGVQIGREVYVKDENGVWHEDEMEIGKIATEFFNDLFKSTNHNNFSSVLNSVHGKVTSQMNYFLLFPYSRPEVKQVVFQMGMNRAS